MEGKPASCSAMPCRTLALMLLVFGLTVSSASARTTVSPLSLFETGLYWLQDLTGQQTLQDPASLLTQMQELAARAFDFGELARRTAGWNYERMDILSRSHYQRRLQDRLFAALASSFGLHDGLPPRLAAMPAVMFNPTHWVQGVWILRRGHPPTSLHFHLQYGPKGWRIVDVSRNGVMFSRLPGGRRF